MDKNPITTNCHEFPTSIQTISIFNASPVTSELTKALLYTIRSVHPYPERINVVDGLSYNDKSVLYIIICPAGLGSDRHVQSPLYYITYQLEPTFILERQPYRDFLSKAIYNWDYSLKNVEFLGNKSTYVSPGCSPNITHKSIRDGLYIYSDKEKTIDVLFLGWDIFERRQKIKNELKEKG